MKNLYKIVFLLSFASCKSQIIPLYPLANSYSTSGAYYKDDQLDLNKFTGTWRYQNGNTSFTIVLTKKTHSYFAPDNCYFDMIVGEYEYIENGISIINTIPQLNNINIGDFNHNLYDGYLLFGQRSSLDPSIIIEKGLTLGFKNPLRAHIEAYARIKYHDSAIPTLEFNLIQPTQFFDVNTLPFDLMIPDEIFILTKIN